MIKSARLFSNAHVIAQSIRPLGLCSQLDVVTAKPMANAPIGKQLLGLSSTLLAEAFRSYAIARSEPNSHRYI